MAEKHSCNTIRNSHSELGNPRILLMSPTDNTKPPAHHRLVARFYFTFKKFSLKHPKNSWTFVYTSLTFHNTQHKSLLHFVKKKIWKGHFCRNILSFCIGTIVGVSPSYIVTLLSNVLDFGWKISFPLSKTQGTKQISCLFPLKNSMADIWHQSVCRKQAWIKF